MRAPCAPPASSPLALPPRSSLCIALCIHPCIAYPLFLGQAANPMVWRKTATPPPNGIPLGIKPNFESVEETVEELKKKLESPTPASFKPEEDTEPFEDDNDEKSGKKRLTRYYKLSIQMDSAFNNNDKHQADDEISDEVDLQVRVTAASCFPTLVQSEPLSSSGSAQVARQRPHSAATF